MKIADVMSPDGTVHTAVANTWGILVISDRDACPDDDSEVSLSPDNDNAPHRMPVNAWALAAHVAGLTSFYKGGDELGAEKSLTVSAPSDSIRVYVQGDYLFQVMPHDKRGTAKSATPHPSTSRSISNAKAEGRLLPTFG
jgi:hypothetical protein